MTQPCGKVVEVVVEGYMPVRVVGWNAGNTVQRRKERCGISQMLLPSRACGGIADLRGERVGGWTGVCGFQGVDRGRLDKKGDIGS